VHAFEECAAVGGSRELARPVGGLDLNESKAHFGAWATISSPLTLGHDLTDDAAYDAAWPVVGNRDAIRVNQAWDGDPGEPGSAGAAPARSSGSH